MAAINVRVPVKQLSVLQQLAARNGTSVSEEVRVAVESAHSPKLSAIEWDGLSGGVTLTLKYVDGWTETAAFDVDQARELLSLLEDAIEAAS